MTLQRPLPYEPLPAQGTLKRLLRIRRVDPHPVLVQRRLVRERGLALPAGHRLAVALAVEDVVLVAGHVRVADLALVDLVVVAVVLRGARLRGQDLAANVADKVAVVVTRVVIDCRSRTDELAGVALDVLAFGVVEEDVSTFLMMEKNRSKWISQ